MKHMEKLHSYNDWGILVLRLVVGAIFIIHGVAKWQIWSAPAGQMTDNMVMLMKLLSIVEPLGGLALILGFLTQWAAAGLAIIMVGAIVFKMKVMGLGFAEMQATGWEFDLVLLAASIVMLFYGAGKVSIDRIWCGKK